MHKIFLIVWFGISFPLNIIIYCVLDVRKVTSPYIPDAHVLLSHLN